MRGFFKFLFSFHSQCQRQNSSDPLMGGEEEMRGLLKELIQIY